MGDPWNHNRWRHWLVDRFGLQPIQDKLLHRRVSKTPWYFGDGATLFTLFGILLVTGALMALTYSPNPDSAYQSIQYITDEQRLGWFIRGLHYWTAGLMMVMLFFHLFRQLLVGGYKSPREVTWLIGVFLFFCVLIMSFTGYTLRWDERAIYAIRVVLHMFYRVPVIGEALVLFVQGGQELGQRTLTRFYAVHVIFVPILIMLLAGYHLYLVILHGTTSPLERRQPVHSAEEQKKLYKEQAHSEKLGETFFPTTMAHSGLMAIVVTGIAVALTFVLGPAELYPEANLTEPSIPAEEWWYWWYSALIALLPPWIAPWFVVVFPLVLFLAMVMLPFIDRSPNRGMRRRPLMVGFVFVCVIAMLFLTDLRRRDLRIREDQRQSVWTTFPRTEPPPPPPGIELTGPVERGRILFAQYGCNTCHAVAGYGPGFGPDLAAMTQRMSRDELESYIRRPPDGIPMPAYGDRMTDEELQRVVEFVLVIQTAPRER